MSESSEPGRIASAFAGLSDRERVLLAIMVVVLGTLATVALSYMATTRMSELQTEIDSKRGALALIAEQRESYARNAAQNAELQEQLQDNRLRLSTFIESRARQASLSPPREFRDNTLPVDGGVTLVTTTAQFESVELEQLEAFMTTIESSDELVFSRNLAVSPARRGSTGLQVELTLSTYRRSGEGSE